MLRKGPPRREAPFSCIFNIEPHLFCVYTSIVLGILQGCAPSFHQLPCTGATTKDCSEKHPRGRDQDVLESHLAMSKKKASTTF